MSKSARKTFLNWSEAEIAEIIRLRDLQLTMPEIAARLGRSKSSVIGLSYRMRKNGTPLPPLAHTRGNGLLPPKKKEPKVKPPPPPPPPPPPEPSFETAVSLFDLKPGGCRWHIGTQGHEHFFCSEPATRRSYCAGHYALAYTKKYVNQPFTQHKKISGTAMRAMNGRI